MNESKDTQQNEFEQKRTQDSLDAKFAQARQWLGPRYILDRPINAKRAA